MRKLDKRSNIVGKIFNGIECLEVTDKKRYDCVVFKFKCHCGNLFEHAGTYVKNGSIKSCGCLRKKNKFKKGNNKKDPNDCYSGIKHIYSDYKTQAKKRKIEFNIKYDDFYFITKKPCFYCGTDPVKKQIKSWKNKKSKVLYEIYYNGVDRLDNDLGYTKENSKPCCSICNHMKRDQKLKDFIKKCQQITRKWD